MARARRLIAVGFLALSGCRSLLGGEEDPGLVQLRESQATWDDAAIANYEYVVANRCFCVLDGDEVRVTVVGGAITSMTLVTSDEPVPTAYASTYRTLDTLFDVIRDAIDRDAVNLEVQYDFVYGFPLHVLIDYSASAQDDHFGWDVVSFTPGT